MATRDGTTTTVRHGVDADVRETGEPLIEYVPEGHRSRKKALLYFPLVPQTCHPSSSPGNGRGTSTMFSCRSEVADGQLPHDSGLD